MPIAHQDDAIQQVIDGLSYLILRFANSTTFPNSGTRIIAELRTMRNGFEDLVAAFSGLGEPSPSLDALPGIKNIAVGQQAKMATAADAEEYHATYATNIKG